MNMNLCPAASLCGPGSISVREEYTRTLQKVEGDNPTRSLLMDGTEAGPHIVFSISVSSPSAPSLILLHLINL